MSGVLGVISDVPAAVQKQTYRGSMLARSMVVSPRMAWENIFMVEVVRSCPEMCRCATSTPSEMFKCPAEKCAGALLRNLQVPPPKCTGAMLRNLQVPC